MHNPTEVQQQSGRIEEFIHQLEASADAPTLAIARELVQALMNLYGAGLERITEVLAQKGAVGSEILTELGADELVGNLLAANGLHPLDLEARVRGALEKFTGRMRPQGTVELLAVHDGVVRLRLHPSSSSCGSLSSLKSGVESAIYDAAPDLVQLSIEVVEATAAAAGFVPLEKLIGYRAVSHNNGTGV